MVRTLSRPSDRSQSPSHVDPAMTVSKARARARPSSLRTLCSWNVTAWLAAVERGDRVTKSWLAAAMTEKLTLATADRSPNFAST
jgi:hypothetical protein